MRPLFVYHLYRPSTESGLIGILGYVVAMEKVKCPSESEGLCCPMYSRKIMFALIMLLLLNGSVISTARSLSQDGNNQITVPNYECSNSLSFTDRQYLTDLANDTWKGIAILVDQHTGLPNDNFANRGYTGIDKIGFYIASVAAARDLGFITEANATARVEKVLTTLKRLETWNGSTPNSKDKYRDLNTKIPYAWYDLSSYNPILNNTLNSMNHDVAVMDLANYYACLVIGRNAFPQLNDSFTRLMKDINWSVFYNGENKTFRSVYNSTSGSFDGEVRDLASDTQTASFLGIATGEVPLEHWQHLDRSFEIRDGHRYYKPGWVAGGLFMQFLPGIFIDQQGTVMGKSAKEFAASQIEHAKIIGAPVWGWSASDATYIDLADAEGIAFYYRGNGSSNALQFKLRDGSGIEFQKRIYNATKSSNWTICRVEFSEMINDKNEHLKDLKNISGIFFAVEGSFRNKKVGEGGKGILSIRNISLIGGPKAVGVDFYGNWKTGNDGNSSLQCSPDRYAKTINLSFNLGQGDSYVQIIKGYSKSDYLGQNRIEDQIVTPHASALAVYYYPREVVENLRRLERMGAKAPLLMNGTNYSIGFRDAINWKSGNINENYLTLDQSMLLLSIANCLNGTVWKYFMTDQIYKKGAVLIGDYSSPLINNSASCMIYRAEGEDWLDQRGGVLDYKSKASNLSCLGDSWGNNSDYAIYAVNLTKTSQAAFLKLRYSDKFDAAGKNEANILHLYWDNSSIGQLNTSDTGDWNNFVWSDEQKIGKVTAGRHMLKIASKNGTEWNCVNLDCFALYA